MTRNIILLATILGSSFGCAPMYDHFDIDAKYTEEELVIIRHSLAEWHTATGSDSADISTTEGVVIGDGVFTEEDYTDDFGTATMQKVSKSEPGYQAIVEEFNKDAAGVGREGQMVITVTDYSYHNGELRADFFHLVVLHELGHFFSLSHGDGLLMSPKPDGVPTCIDQESLDNFCKIHVNCLNPKNTCDE